MGVFYVYSIAAFGFIQLVSGQMVSATFDSANTTNFLNADGNTPECSSIGLEAIPLNGSTFDVVPPFYMLSFALGGIGMIDYIGSDSNNLTWTVRHPQGNQVLFYIVDGNKSRSVGNVLPISSGSSNCHSTEISSDVKVIAGASQIQTCDELSLSLTGGTKPYTVSVINDLFTNNFTLGPNDDTFNYVDQVASGVGFIVAASDENDQWAIGTNLISSVGSSDLTCPGKTSAGSSSSSKSSNTGAIAGGIVGGLVFLAAAIGLIIYFYLKRRKETRLSATNRKHSMPFDHDDVSPYVLQPGSDGNMQYAVAPSAYASSYHAPSYPPAPSSSSGTRSGPLSDTSDVPLLHSPPGQQRPRLASTVQGGAYVSHTGSIYNDGSDPYLRSTSPEPIAGGSSQLGLVTNAAPLTSKQLLMAREEERRRQTIVQHQDAEDILDVPPSYRERTVGPSGA